MPFIHACIHFLSLSLSCTLFQYIHTLTLTHTHTHTHAHTHTLSQESVVEEEKAVEVLDQKIREMEREIALQRQLTGGYRDVVHSHYIHASIHTIHS